MRIQNKLKSYILILLLLTMCMQVLGSTIYTDPKHRYKINLYCERIELITSHDLVQTSCDHYWKQVYVKTYFSKSQKQMDRILQSTIKDKIESIKAERFRFVSKKIELFRGMPITIIAYKRGPWNSNDPVGGIAGIFVYRHNKRNFSVYEITSISRLSSMLSSRIIRARKQFDTMMGTLVFGKYKKFKTRVKFTVKNALNKFRGKHIDRLYKGWGVPQDERMTTKSKFLIYKFYKNSDAKLNDRPACTITFQAATTSDKIKNWDLRFRRAKSSCDRLIYKMYLSRGLFK